MRILGIDPGSVRTGYGCIDTDGIKCQMVCSGVFAMTARSTFPERLLAIHASLTRTIDECQPACVAVESLFHAVNVRSAFALAHARGVIVLAATQAGLPVVEYAPAEVKRAVAGYGRAEKQQVQHMVRLLLGLATLPTPFDVADALAVAICHAQSTSGPLAESAATPFATTRSGTRASLPRRWRDMRPDDLERR